MTQKHEFALYVQGLEKAPVVSGKQFLITDPQLVHRIYSVLRLEKGNVIQLFDEAVHIQYQLDVVDKKKIEGIVLGKKENLQLAPHITVLLPVLKKEAFEQALYSCVELGVNEIQLITTEKVQRTLYSATEIRRLQAILIAAAEQSKNFTLPVLKQPIPLHNAIKILPESTSKLVADIHGSPLFNIMQDMIKNKPANIVIMVGPEGDFTIQETALLKKAGFQLCKLTPTVLRSQQALAVLVGAVRAQ